MIYLIDTENVASEWIEKSSLPIQINHQSCHMIKYHSCWKTLIRQALDLQNAVMENQTHWISTFWE